MKPTLPPPSRTSRQQPDQKSTTATKAPRKPFHKRRLRPLLRSYLHFLLYTLIQLIYGILLRFSHSYAAVTSLLVGITHYHHRTPEYIHRDVASLSRVPEHLSVILKYQEEQDGALEKLMDDVAELAAWSVSAGIGLLSVYEKTGVLKSYRGMLQEMVEGKLGTYFGEDGESRPGCRVHASGNGNGNGNGNGGHAAAAAAATVMRRQTNGDGAKDRLQHINVLLLSAADGRDTLVDLTRTLTEMAQAKKIRPKDITSDLINTEISATTAVPGSAPQQASTMAKKEVGVGEPDLVIVFGPYVKLDGYPPWQIRLSEIFCVGGDPSAGNFAVEYQGFLRGLWKFAGAEMRFGR